jgi:hypothetical protein
MMGTFLICCLWGQCWIGATRVGTIGWFCSLIAGARGDAASAAELF